MPRLADRKARHSSICSNGSSWAQLVCEVAMFKLVSFGRAAFLETLNSPSASAVCVRMPVQTHIHLFISLLLPGETLTLGLLFLLLVDITKLSVLPGGALTFTLS